MSVSSKYFCPQVSDCVQGIKMNKEVKIFQFLLEPRGAWCRRRILKKGSRLNIALLVVECVVSIHPDIFHSADWVIGILLWSGAWLPPWSTEFPWVPLDGGLPALAWDLNHCWIQRLHGSCKKTVFSWSRHYLPGRLTMANLAETLVGTIHGTVCFAFFHALLAVCFRTIYGANYRCSPVDDSRLISLREGRFCASCDGGGSCRSCGSHTCKPLIIFDSNHV